MTIITKYLKISILASVVAATSILSISSVSAFEAPKRGAQQAENMFARLDANLDEILSLNEMTDPISARAAKLLGRKDKDLDSLLTLEEMQKRHSENSHDLTEIAEEIVLCVSEIKAATGNEAIDIPSVDHFKSAEEKFSSADTSGDGFIDLDELQNVMLTKANNGFTAMDSNEDGSVTNEEFNTHLSARLATKEAIRGCIKEIQDVEDIL
jgi:Ca2+-binding EF-hand superfamily protein